MLSFAATIDVRTYQREEKQPMIFGTFEKLLLGETMELINDHDPQPLYQKFMICYPEQFLWEYLEQGPEVWRIGITKK
ncbi:DUF2249 domain-containing protein [Clostridium cellulovorans]|uniref:DUF2249 domain-containing protein n=1 Tax=Clostridium cellulovorans (strain ATCC 35296 / DSM 3052 / OCM 3 / 743B) TaxID=573061 RepID=D9SUP6_CLOC7|nr:DUF2249 domain-containing protein [Clostridium cellulovorans]ADL50951.1 hypothetical protein Clocel_1195 [Clostridium cellulovorans 743B]